jgi:hypothetical protein
MGERQLKTTIREGGEVSGHRDKHQPCTARAHRQVQQDRGGSDARQRGCASLRSLGRDCRHSPKVFARAQKATSKPGFLRKRNAVPGRCPARTRGFDLGSFSRELYDLTLPQNVALLRRISGSAHFAHVGPLCGNFLNARRGQAPRSRQYPLGDPI